MVVGHQPQLGTRVPARAVRSNVPQYILMPEQLFIGNEHTRTGQPLYLKKKSQFFSFFFAFLFLFSLNFIFNDDNSFGRRV